MLYIDGKEEEKKKKKGKRRKGLFIGTETSMRCPREVLVKFYFRSCLSSITPPHLPTYS
jgi:hypothetical protein